MMGLWIKGEMERLITAPNGALGGFCPQLRVVDYKQFAIGVKGGLFP